MAKVLIRKPKRATLLTKRSVCMGKKFREKSHKLLYENIKKNNSYLAKALSHEKQNNQTLFKQNLSLFAQIQNLNITCNKQTNIITNIQNNAKEMIKMLVPMSRFLTDTLTMCQEFVASSTAARLSSVSTGRKDVSKKMSPKSPAKGVVKPMVSGHTITKPTINLSRINTENVTNISRLSIVQEVLTPERNGENENSSSVTPFTTSTLRYENNRRLPERIRISSPRVSDAEADNGQRRQRRSRHSRRMGSYTRLESERWSVDETPRHSRDRMSMGSPRVKLRDVSKLLQDSQTINIRRLTGTRIDDIEMQEDGNNVSQQNTSERNVITESQMSITLNDEDESYVQTSKTDSNAKTRKVFEKDFDKTLYAAGKSRQNNSRDWEEDPLEGPSWLFSNTLNMPSRDNEPEEVDSSHNFDVNNNSEITYTESSDAESIEDQSRNPVESMNESMNVLTRERSISAPSIINRVRCESLLIGDDNTDNNIYEAMSTMSDHERRLNDTEDGTNYASFVTVRRGHSEVTEEEEDDFTLMLTCPTPQNLQFNINDLRLPDDEDTVTHSARETRVDSAKSTDVPSILDRNEHVQTIKQPLTNNNEITSVKKKQKNKKAKTSKSKDKINQSERYWKSTKKVKKINSESSRDPSAAKVVLEKLNESHIKSRLSSDDDTDFRRTNGYATEIVDNQGDSQSLDSENQRPKRRNAPITLKEPSLRKKLRRD